MEKVIITQHENLLKELDYQIERVRLRLQDEATFLYNGFRITIKREEK